MRAVVALSLSMLLCLPGFSQEPVTSPDLIRQKISKIKPGNKLTVKLHNKEKIKGVFLSVEDGGTSMKIAPNKGGASRVINFSDIEKVSRPMPGWQMALLITGAVFGVLFILAANGIPNN